MAITTTTHLNFRGDARAALEFYRSVFGGQLTVVTYGDFGMPADLPGADKVVFGQVTAENGFRVMAYDVPGQAARRRRAGRHHPRERHDDHRRAVLHLRPRRDRRGGQRAVGQARRGRRPSSSRTARRRGRPGFGMLTDRFGVTWISTSPPRTAG